MTDKEELIILEAIERMRNPDPVFSKVYVRLIMCKENSEEETLNLQEKCYPESEVVNCTNISIQEWDSIPYKEEYRSRIMFLKYI